MIDSKRIAKNTVILYVRMLLIMAVTLYTSRIVLAILGIENYGLLNSINGLIGILSFVNGTLSIGTSRFITYELGKSDNKVRLAKTFSTAFYTHIMLSIIIVLLMETVGMWFFYNELVLPREKIDICFKVFQFLLLGNVISIIQVPYTASIMAHEKMNIYAYISIFEAVSRLLICYMLSCSINIDKLVLYSILLFLVNLVVFIFYHIYCKRNFEECEIKLGFNVSIFKDLINFSGWNILANFTETLRLQGIIVLINIFFSPAIVAAQAIANQVTTAMMHFINNFRTAINPQIIKLYASNNKAESKKLTLDSTIYCFDMILLIGLPAIFVMDRLLEIWLVEVPDYAVIFIKWIIITRIIDTFSASFYIPMMAANNIKTNAIASSITGLGQFLILYFLLKLGLSVMWVQYTSFIAALISACFIKPYILYRDLDYSLYELFKCYLQCLKILLLALVISIISYYSIDNSGTGFILLVFVIAAGVVISSLVFMKNQDRKKLFYYISKKIIGNVRKG